MGLVMTDTTSSEDSRAADLPYARRVDTQLERPPNTPVGRFDIAVMAIRLLALYLIVQAVPGLLAVFINLAMNRSGIDALMNYAVVGIIGGAGVAVWLIAKWLALFILPAQNDFHSNDESLLNGPADLDASRRLFTTFIGVAGVLACVVAVPKLASLIGYMASTTPADRQPYRTYFAEQLAGVAAYLGVGLMLFFNSRRIGEKWRQTLTLPPDEPPGNAKD
jgi:hypothetical protein